jgi:8-amino-7-oxononanoate synthase
MNVDGTPIVELPLARGADLAVVADILWRRGVYVTLAPYPMVPADEVGFRVQLTAAHTDDQVGRLNGALCELAGNGLLRRATPAWPGSVRVSAGMTRQRRR